MSSTALDRIRLHADPVIAVGCVALFWIGTFTGAALFDGYSVTQDVISTLAGRGSEVAALGIASILLVAVAHLAGARALGGTVARILVLAAVATVGIAVFPVSVAPPEDDVIDAVHTGAVAAYAVLIVSAMVTLGVRRRRLRVLSFGAAIVSVSCLAATFGDDPGLWQRLWVATNLGWLLVVTAWASGQE